MLATLFKDERCQQLPAYAILEKMYLDRIIRRSELHEFEALMQTHQKVTSSSADRQSTAGYKLSPSTDFLRPECIIRRSDQHEFEVLMQSHQFTLSSADIQLLGISHPHRVPSIHRLLTISSVRRVAVLHCVLFFLFDF